MHHLLEVNLLFWAIIVCLTIFIAALAVLFSKSKPQAGQAIIQAYQTEDIDYTVFLIGDMGALTVTQPDPLAVFIKDRLKDAGKESAIIFLGDNIYPRGLYEELHYKRKYAEKRLNAELDMVKGHPGRIFFLSGNHDWNKGSRGGWEYVIRQEKYIEEYLGRGNVFLPDMGCPGPVSIELRTDLQLIIINTQWWPQEGTKPIGAAQGCRAESKEHFFKLLHEDLQKNKGKRILVAAHHPLYSYSAHGGKFHYKHHIFPLRALHKKFYLPLPVLGSLYPLYRKVFGAKEDLSHPAYKRLRRQLASQLLLYPNLIYAAGHDHNLQYIKRKQLHHIISGSGSKTAYVGTGKHARFTSSGRGFFCLNYLKNGKVFIEAWELDKNTKEAKLAYLSEAF